MSDFCDWILSLLQQLKVQVDILANGTRLLFSFHRVRRATKIKFYDEFRKEITMGLTLSTVQKCPVSITPVDKKGNKAPVDGIPEWNVSAPGIVSLFPAADGMSCDIVALALGTAQVNVKADADLGSGVTTITGVLDVEVVASQAVGFAINTGTVVDQ